MALHNDLGRWGEDVAAEYLYSKDWYIRHRDWRYGHHDIDLVAIDGDMTTLLFVEVKTRSSDVWGCPDKAIDSMKRASIIRSVAAYVRSYKLEHLDVRYDTISIIGTPDTGYTIEHKENAFDVTARYLFYEEKRRRPAQRSNHPGRW